MQIRSWGPTLSDAFEGFSPCIFMKLISESALGMLGYMTDLSNVSIDPNEEVYQADIEGWSISVQLVV